MSKIYKICLGLVILFPVEVNAGYAIKKVVPKNCRTIHKGVMACEDVIRNNTCYITSSGMATVSNIHCVKN